MQLETVAAERRVPDAAGSAQGRGCRSSHGRKRGCGSFACGTLLEQPVLEAAEQRELEAAGAAPVGAAGAVKQEVVGAARVGPLQSNSRQWLMENRQMKAAGAAREGCCWSSSGRRLPELPEAWLQDWLGTKVADSVRVGSCSNSPRRRLREQCKIDVVEQHGRRQREQLKGLREQLETEAAGAATAGGCGRR